MPSKSIRITAGSALAITGAAALFACVANQPGASASTAAGSGTTMQFTAHDEHGNETLEDLGAKSPPGGPDIGDLLAFTQRLTRHGNTVGQVHVFAVGVDHRRHLSEATGTIVLSRGTISVSGIVTMKPRFTLAVVGGTGAFEGRTGTIEFDHTGSAQNLIVHLRDAGR
jgi:hypothetical protein